MCDTLGARMRFRVVVGCLVLSIAACRTHTVDVCLPACGASEQAFFASCVASGGAGCSAGNRRCCALAAHCVGSLDDQMVVSSRTMCMHEVRSLDGSRPDVGPDVDGGSTEVCDPPCTSNDVTHYQACLSGSDPTCMPPNDACCALAQNCNGSLDDVYVTEDGCCANDADCANGEHCDSASWACTSGTSMPPVCGDRVVTPPEQCDPPVPPMTCPYGQHSCPVGCDAECRALPSITSFCGDGIVDPAHEQCDPPAANPFCTYGLMSCTVCDPNCNDVAGNTSFCGDGRIDSAHGEQCDPPTPTSCDVGCHTASGPSCPNGVMDGNETDVDCGGGAPCPPCPPLAHCRAMTDCIAPCPTDMITCDATNVCMVTTSPCDDGNACTDDLCGPTGSCGPHQPIDRDMDTFPPLADACGTDCNDFVATIHPGAAEACNGRDDDCDMIVDEMCM
jgi:hypothetical protein